MESEIVISQESLCEAALIRTNYLIQHYFQGVPQLNRVSENPSMVLGVTLSWLERAANDVPQFRIWLEEELRSITNDVAPFDL